MVSQLTKMKSSLPLVKVKFAQDTFTVTLHPYRYFRYISRAPRFVTSVEMLVRTRSGVLCLCHSWFQFLFLSIALDSLEVVVFFSFLLIQDISSWDMFSSQTDTLFLPFYMKRVSEFHGWCWVFSTANKTLCRVFYLFVALSSVLLEEDACCCLLWLESSFQERVFL